MPRILLLDCSSTLAAKLKRQAFDVDVGTIGFCTGTRYLPCQVYERDILVYNPSSVDYVKPNDIHDSTPEYGFANLRDHIQRGATILIFLNHVDNNIIKQNRAYSWLPFMPEMKFTKDEKVLVNPHVQRDYGLLVPIVSEAYVKIPVLQKLITPLCIYGNYVPLLYNLNEDVIGAFLEPGNGRLIILPECQSNEDIINTFLHRVIPKLYNLEVRKNLIDEFVSPEEETTQNTIQKTNKQIQELIEVIEAENEKLNSAKRKKIQTVEKDETATRILMYHNLARQQEDVALFYLYKVIEALERKCGGEKEAKRKLGCNREWNLIGKVANASYADIRHAPKPGEKIKEWTQDEIDICFKAGKKIIHAYFATLF